MRLVTDDEPRTPVVLREAEPHRQPEVTSDQAVALAYAEAIARPGTKALLLNSNNAAQVDENGNPKWVVLAEAVASGFAYAIQPRSRLLVLDIDKPEHHEWAARLTGLAMEAGWDVVRVASGGGSDRFHLWIIFPPGWGFRETKRWALENGAVGEAVRADDGQRVRPPGSPHRSGIGRAAVFGMGPAEALRIFREAMDRPLPELAAMRLREFTPATACHDRWGKPARGITLYSTALAAVNAGWEFEQWHKELVNPANETASKYREKPPLSAQNWALGRWTQACKRVRENPAVGSAAAVRQKVERLRNRTDIAWKGQSGATDRAVYLALLDVAYAGATLTPTASGRQLAEMANVTHKTVRSSLRRLAAKPHRLIRKAGVLQEERITRWAIAPPPTEGAASPLSPEAKTSPLEPTTSPPMGGHRFLVGSTGVLLDDIFVNGAGLGINTRATWEALTSEPLTADKIRSRRPPGPSHETVLKHLNKLRDNGFAARQGNRWTRIDPTEAELQERADRLGVKGKNAKRKKLHADERAERQRRLLNMFGPQPTQ